MTLNFLDKILSDALNPRSSQRMIDERKREASAKGKCQRLAKKLGLVFEVDRSYQPPLWTLEHAYGCEVSMRLEWQAYQV
jgi:hypothetical protein